ncbi:hypothetical protein CPC08DRAFT_323568 [Agrocybe pediades]|nr:hypothetical protein CPC08DRAFT_323568 [Agrocybe pediades]
MGHFYVNFTLVLNGLLPSLLLRMMQFRPLFRTMSGLCSLFIYFDLFTADCRMTTLERRMPLLLIYWGSLSFIQTLIIVRASLTL